MRDQTTRRHVPNPRGRESTGMRMAMRDLMLPPELADALDYVAEATGLAKGAIMRQAFAEWVLGQGLVGRGVDPVMTRFSRKEAS